VRTSFQIITVPTTSVGGIRRQQTRPASKKLSSQQLFKLPPRSVTGLRAAARVFGSAPEVAFGSAVAISEDLALTNCQWSATKGAYAWVLGKREHHGLELVAANYDGDRCVIGSAA